MKKSTKEKLKKIWQILNSDIELPSYAQRSQTAIVLMQISMLLDAGFPMKTTLAIAAKKTTFPFFRKIIPEIADSMSEGMFLSDAVAQYPKVFTKHDSGVIRIGEKSGRLSKSLAFLSESIQREEDVKKKILSAVAYPIFIVILCIFAVYFAVPTVVSTFESAYSGSSDSLPAITEFVINASEFTAASAPYTAAAVLLIIAVFSILYRKSKRFSLKIDTLKLHLPFFGLIEKNRTTAKFSRALAWLSDSGCHADEIFDIIASAYTNRRCVRDISAIPKKLSRGVSFADAVASSECFSSELKESSAMFSGKYDTKNALVKTADMLDRENEMAISRFTASLGIISTVAVAVFILFVALAVFLPIFSIDIQI